MGHAERHPTYHEGCSICRWRSVSISPAATPTRAPEAAEVRAREERWDRDMAAYKRLRHQGLQPPGIDGCAALESGANEKVEVERGKVIDHPGRRRDAAETAAVATEIGSVGHG